MNNFIAVCHNCRKRHALTREQFLHTNSVRDWEMKHKGHQIEFLNEEVYAISIARHAVGEYRHNADIKLAYSADTDYTITLGSLASSSTLLAGRESTSVSNTTNLYLDYIIAGNIRLGSSPTASKTIQVLAVGAQDDTPTWPDVFDGTDSAETVTSENVKNGYLRAIASMTSDATTSRDFPFGPVSLAQILGQIPTHHVLFVTHDTVAALSGSGHVITYHGIYATVS